LRRKTPQMFHALVRREAFNLTTWKVFFYDIKRSSNQSRRGD